MNSSQSPSAAPEETPLTGEAVVTAYLAQELPKARQGLKRTHIIGIILILFVGAYIGIISTILVNFFQPKAAAEVATGTSAPPPAAWMPIPRLSFWIHRGPACINAPWMRCWHSVR